LKLPVVDMVCGKEKKKKVGKEKNIVIYERI